MARVGLRFADDLDAWERWQQRQHPLRAVKGWLRPARASGLLTRGSADADLLVVLDSTSPSNVAALLAPTSALPSDRVAVLSSTPVVALLAPHEWVTRRWDDGDPLGPVSAVLTAGHYLPLGRVGHREALARGVPELISQHGLLTPLAPPLPERSKVLAWSAADADFWRSGRDDVDTVVVGSQLLHEAAAQPTARVNARSPVTYLGQLHGAELPRSDLTQAAETFCTAHGAVYRPHPSERDRRSLQTHERWEAAGITVDRARRPLSELDGGVVSVFSTGVLEAAARGLPAWVDFPSPPGWLAEFWQRYDMRAWSGADSTPPPPTPDLAPARAVARALEEVG